VPIDLEKPEAFLFAFKDRGETYAVRINAGSADVARSIYARLSPADKRARVVARMQRRERDHIAELGVWLKAALRRLRRAAA
jgi:predicted RecB family endonuclease